jgi:hypothetical protein
VSIPSIWEYHHPRDCPQDEPPYACWECQEEYEEAEKAAKTLRDGPQPSEAEAISTLDKLLTMLHYRSQIWPGGRAHEGPFRLCNSCNEAREAIRYEIRGA